MYCFPRKVQGQKMTTQDERGFTKTELVMFNPQAPNMLVSGSWDRQVRFWDVRANRLSNSIGGQTSICGDGVDIS